MYISLAVIIYILYHRLDMSYSTNFFVIGAIIATVYFLLKFLEMRFVEQDNHKPIKVLIRDTIVVGISSVIGVFLLEQFKMFDTSNVYGSGGGVSSSPAAFVDTPGF